MSKFFFFFKKNDLLHLNLTFFLKKNIFRFIEYKSTSLERNYKYEVLTEHDLGVTIDLINKDTYAPNYNIQLDPADEKLLEEDIITPQDSKR